MTCDTTPSLSVIIAVYNGAKTLQQCLDSVARQSYPHVELIVIDGGSQDDTAAILAANDSAIHYWVSESDKGIYDAWNKALSVAQGEWVCFLGADDYFFDRYVVARLVAALKALPEEVNVAYGQVMLLTEDGQELFATGEPWGVARKKFRSYMSIPHQAVMHRRTLFERGGVFDATYKIAGDYELLMRELKNREAVYMENLIVAGMRRGGISSNPKFSVLALQEMRRAQRTHGLSWPMFGWVLAVLKVYVRTLVWRVLGEKLSRKTFDLFRSFSGKPGYWNRK